LVRNDAASGVSDIPDRDGPWVEMGNLRIDLRCAANAVSNLDREHLLQRAVEESGAPARAARKALRAAAWRHARGQPGTLVADLNLRNVDRISINMAPRAVQCLLPATQVFTRWPI
jgi:hypothetical protein